ncbi:MAG TPA: hypothetical protein VLL52_13245 [Anaerolineae bacterium]|nr:hypothetical protein [Anaerolineae bacterium]
MNQKLLTKTNPTIFIEQHGGDLLIRTWEESAIEIHGGQYEINEKEQGFVIQSHSSLTLTVPVATTINATSSGNVVIKNLPNPIYLQDVRGNLVLKNVGAVSLETVYGNIAAKNIDGPCQIGLIRGDMSLRNTGPLTIKAIQGDCQVRFVNGDVTIQEAYGDVSFHTVSGQFQLDKCHRDLMLNNMAGICQVSLVMGDIRLQDSLISGEHSLTAQGDIVVRWDTNAPLNVVATAATVVNQLPLDNVSEHKGTFSGQLGDGQTVLRLKATGDIILKGRHTTHSPFLDDMDDMDLDFDIRLEGLGEVLSTQIGQRLNQLGSQMNQFATKLEKELGSDFAEQMAQKAAQQAERAVNRAMRHMERARQRTATPPTPPPAPAKQASPEEQLQILKMLEKGVISIDEANELLEALEN